MYNLFIVKFTAKCYFVDSHHHRHRRHHHHQQQQNKQQHTQNINNNNKTLFNEDAYLTIASLPLVTKKTQSKYNKTTLQNNITK